MVARLLTIAAFLGATLGAGSASAYVCNVRYIAGSGNAGTEGHVYFTDYSQPNCAGTYNGAFTLCSHGGASELCPSSDYLRYDRASLLALFQALQMAAADGRRVSYATTGSCMSGGTSCLAYIYFR